MVRAVAIVWALLAVAPAFAQGGPELYRRAGQDFLERWDARARLDIQIDLIATGHANGVPDEGFPVRTFEAIRSLQTSRGLEPTGILGPSLRQDLLTEATEQYRVWRFRALPQPVRGHPIWMPTGMGLVETVERGQLDLRDPDGKIEAHYRFFPADLAATASALLAGYRQNGVTVHYKVTRPDWFVISTTNRDGKDGYLRYHAVPGGIIGFALFWDNARGNVHGERVAVLMSSSLRAAVTGAPFLTPPTLSSPLQTVRTMPEQRSEPPRVPAPAPAQAVSSGTGFFVTPAGLLATNAHVVDGCGTIVVRTDDGSIRAASLLARDKTNDLALLRTDGPAPASAAIRSSVRLGEGVAAFGFPHSQLLASTGNFTRGDVTSTAGLGDDSRYLQISAPVQSGNSGGPLLDDRGRVVGVVSAKLNALKVALSEGDLPQNVNFAIKASLLGAFLDSNNVPVERGDDTAARLEPPDIAQLARRMSVFVLCRP